jgi:hypothetical protein
MGFDCWGGLNLMSLQRIVIQQWGGHPHSSCERVLAGLTLSWRCHRYTSQLCMEENFSAPT